MNFRRLDSANKSPIFSHFGETLNGVTTIRSFNSQKRFINMMEEKINISSLFYYPNSVADRYSFLFININMSTFQILMCH